MNKKILFSAVSIVSALGLLVGATFANFSSQAGNNGNTFGAGTLTLKINGAGDSSSTKMFTVTDAKPGDSKTEVFDLSNSGTVDASSTTLTSLNVTPNASGDLGEVLTLQLYIDANNNNVFDAGDTLIHSGHINAGWSALPLGFGLAHGADQKVTATLTFDSAATDSYQGKSVSFDFTFTANQ